MHLVRCNWDKFHPYNNTGNLKYDRGFKYTSNICFLFFIITELNNHKFPNLSLL